MARRHHTRLASRSVLGKRKFSRTSNRPFKRRRFSSRRKTSTYTSQSGAARSIGFTARRTTRRRWNSLLWTSTLQKSHYRAVGANSITVTTPANSETSTVRVFNGLSNDISVFWVAAGGAQILDTAIPIPLFQGDIILRGATAYVSLTNENTDSSPIMYKVYLIKTGDGFDATAVPTTVPVGWDPSLIPEFKTRVGRIVMQREGVLENLATAVISRKIPIMKIDQINWNVNKNVFVWFVVAHNAQNNTAVSLAITYYFNLSFAADAIGST